MRRILGIAVAVCLVTVFSGNAFAAGKSGRNGMALDGTLSIGTEPASGFGDTLGLGFGMSLDLTRDLGVTTGKLMGRADITYYQWDASEFGVDVSYTRVPIFLGGRFYLPMESRTPFDIYLEGGLEFSFDKAEANVPFLGKRSESELHIGITPGAGIELPLSDTLYVGGSIRLHMITDSYLSVAATIGTKF